MIKFKVDCNEPIRGYVAEVYKRHFQIPSLGPIGSNVIEKLIKIYI